MSYENKYYLKAIQYYLDSDSRSLVNILKTTNLNLFEKQLIKARILVRNCKLHDAIKMLDLINPSNKFEAAERFFVLASAHSALSNWHLSMDYIQQSFLIYESLNNYRGMFLTLYNMSVYQNRFGFDHQSDIYLAQAKKYANTESQISLILRAEACSHFRRGFKKLALKKLDESLIYLNTLSKVEQSTLLSVAADIYFGCGRDQIAFTFLEKAMIIKIKRDRARILFEHAALKNLLKNDKYILNTIPEEVRGNSEYFLKWKVLSGLNSGHKEQVIESWNKLTTEFPMFFGENFEIKHEPMKNSIFGAALKRKLAVKKSEVKFDLNLTKKQKELILVLQHSVVSLRKEELIEKIWGISYDPAYDSRFYKLVQRCKKYYDISVQLGAYKISA